MDRSLLMFILSLTCFYFILDEFVGQKRITNMLQIGLVPTAPPPKREEESEGGEGSTATEPFDPNEAAPDNPTENGKETPIIRASDIIRWDKPTGGGLWV